MNTKKTLSLVTLTAVSISLVACGRSANNFVDFSTVQTVSTQSVNTFGNLKNGDVIPGEFIVKFKPGSKNSLNALDVDGTQNVKPIGSSNSGMFLVKSNSEISTLSSETLKANPNILWSEPNRVITIPKVITNFSVNGPSIKADFPNDPMFSQQYSHKVTHAQEGWAISKGASLVLAIVDTGVDINHPDLKDKVVPGHSAFEGEDPGVDKQGHGTHCAGIAAASINNGIGVAGVAPNAKIQPVKVLNDQGEGSDASVADGIVWAATHGAKVISMSLGGPGDSKAMDDAVALALKNDVLVVAAMGNDGNSTPSFPAAIKGVMAVGATDSSDKIASFSQFGKHISVSAPGVDILSTFPTGSSAIGDELGVNSYGSISGTSMATPYVAGLAALVRGAFPSLNSQQARTKIEKAADDLGTPGFDQHFGFGRVNVAKALAGASVKRF